MSMSNGVVEGSFEQIKQGSQVVPEQAKQRPRVVNADEVTNETMHIPVFCYEDEPVFYDNGKPFLDKQGNQRVGRVSAGTRTAKIKNMAPIDVYTQAMSLFSDIEGGLALSKLSKEQLDCITDMILECWKISEPWMTKEELREGVDGLRLIEIFSQVFFKESPLSNNKA